MSACPNQETDQHFLRMAARLALRGHGRAEPNPLVGCVIVDRKNNVVGWGFHRKFGGPHAEIEALRRAGSRAVGSTCFITLEPCNHTGKTGPCTQALINAEVSRVVIGRADKTDLASGGAKKLFDHRVDVHLVDESLAHSVSDAFFHRVETGRPWVVAKWAQTLDGRIATRTGDSQWISCPRSRAMVHRQRGRVDVILTGIGTVLHDDPMLTARCRSVRRIARRVVVDANLETPLTSRLVQTAREFPTAAVCTKSAFSHRLAAVRKLEGVGVDVIACGNGDEVALDPLLQLLASHYSASTMLVEAGAGLMGRLFDQRLINEAWVFTAPTLLGDAQALPVARGRTVETLTEGIQLELIDHRRRDADVMLRYRVVQ